MRRRAFKVRIEVRAIAIRGCAGEGGICTGSGYGGFNLSFLGLALVFDPEFSVVDFGEGRWPSAAGEDAAAVAGDDEVA